jgi:hypothetical protein
MPNSTMLRRRSSAVPGNPRKEYGAITPICTPLNFEFGFTAVGPAAKSDVRFAIKTLSGTAPRPSFNMWRLVYDIAFKFL